MKLCVRIRRTETGDYVAYCPSLPGCVCQGSTEEQAKEQLEEAIRGYLASINNFVPAQLETVLEYQV